jgi:hypothetical protein
MLQLRHARDSLEEITISDINRYDACAEPPRHHAHHPPIHRYLLDNADLTYSASKQPPLLHQLDRFISGGHHLAFRWRGAERGMGPSEYLIMLDAGV